MIIPGDEFEAYCHLGLWYSVGAAANLVVTRLVSVSVKLWTALFFLLMASVSILMLPYVISCAPSKKNKVHVCTRSSMCNAILISLENISLSSINFYMGLIKVNTKIVNCSDGKLNFFDNLQFLQNFQNETIRKKIDVFKEIGDYV